MTTLETLGERLGERLGETLGQTLGDFLREQRRGARLTLRQLAEQTGVSNPYLSQIERGLRRPSAEVLQQLARGLRISARTLYVRAGMLDPDDAAEGSVEHAVRTDPSLTERQRSVLLDIYSSFRHENRHLPEPAQPEPAQPEPAQPEPAQPGRAKSMPNI